MRISKQGYVRQKQRSTAACCALQRGTTKAQEKLCLRASQTGYEMIFRRLLCLRARSRSWRSQVIPGRVFLSLKGGSSVGAGVGRWWRAGGRV